MSRISIARLKTKSKALGPGCRAVIWTHGCSRHCPQCIAKEMNESAPLFHYSAQELYAWVASCDGIDGITVSGGEPFEQDLRELSMFLNFVKNDPRHLSVICYTGNTIENLKQSKLAQEVLKNIDVLIDGAYIYERNNGHKLRGSDNQRIHILSQLLKDELADVENEYDRPLEIVLDKNLKMELTGIPPQGFLENLEKKLDENGFCIENNLNNHTRSKS